MQEHDRLLAPMACPGFLSISIHLVMTGSRDFSVASFSSSTDWNLKGPVPRRSRLIMHPLAAFTLTQDNSSPVEDVAAPTAFTFQGATGIGEHSVPR